MGVDASSSFSTVGARVVRRFFWYVDGADIDSSSGDCATIHGTLQLHSIRSSSMRDPTIFTRRHSCFCGACILFDWEDCQMTEWADTWHQQILRPLHDAGPSSPIEPTQEVRFSDDFDSLTDLLAEGDDFAVIAEQGNDEGVDFYVLQCTRPKMFLDSDTVDGFGDSYDAHSLVVYGHYYQQLRVRGHNIQFQQYQWEREVIHYSHLVLAVKLRLERVHSKKGGAPRWRLDPDDHESIMDAVRSRDNTMGCHDICDHDSDDSSHDDMS